MGDEDRVERRRLEAEARQPRRGVAHAEPAVDHDPGASGLDDEAVALAAAADRGEAHQPRRASGRSTAAVAALSSWSRSSARMRSLFAARSGAPFGSWTRHRALGGCLGDLDPVLLGLSLSSVLPEHQLRRGSRFAGLARHRRRRDRHSGRSRGRCVRSRSTTVKPVRSSAKPDPAPRPVEGVVDDQLRRAVGGIARGGRCRPQPAAAAPEPPSRPVPCRPAAARRSAASSAPSISASSSGRRQQRPRERRRGCVVDLGRRHLLHAAMRDEDLDRARLDAALDARAELVALVGRVEDVDVLADQVAADQIVAGCRRGSRPSRSPSRRSPAARPRARIRGRSRTGASCSTTCSGVDLDHQPALGAGAHDPRVGRWFCGSSSVSWRGRARLLGGEPVRGRHAL